YDPVFGARPLKRVMQRSITNALSEKILRGEVSDGDTVEVNAKNREIVVTKKS
ncbi:MAG: chaperone protein ClpB, partial [Chlorobiales bacterium]|nr:chaperone protein ClpB [Chlorobiales bacterium]